MSLFGKLFGKKDTKAKGEKKLPEEEDGQVRYMKPKETASTPEKTIGTPATPAAPKEEPTVKAEKPVEKKPAEKKPAAPKEEVAVKAEKPAEKKPTEKKPAEKKPAEKKPAPAKEEKPVQESNEEAESIATAETSESVALPTRTGPVGKFDLKKSKDGRFVFNLLAANRVIVATSQVYSSSTAAMNGIHSVIANAAKAPVEDQTLKNYTPLGYPKWEIYLDKGNQYRFRLNASNGSCICHSQGYTTKASCKNGIESIIRTVKDADTEKSYLKKDEAKGK